MTTAFDPGRVVVRRTLQPDGRVGGAQSARVVADDARGLRLWLARGSATLRRVDLAGQTVRHLPWAAELHVPTMLAPSTWGPNSTLMLLPPSVPWSVWWTWDADDRFTGWYVNLETPARRWNGGVDVHDRTLDMLVAPDGTVSMKDEDEFAVQTDDPHFWSAEQAGVIRADAERVAADARAGRFPFDGTWCAPGALLDEPPTAMPWWWDVPAGTSSEVVTEVVTEAVAAPVCPVCGA